MIPSSRVDFPQTGLATPEEVAEFLKVSRSTVYSLMSEGKIDFYRVGRLRRIKWSDVQGLLVAAGR